MRFVLLPFLVSSALQLYLRLGRLHPRVFVLTSDASELSPYAKHTLSLIKLSFLQLRIRASEIQKGDLFSIRLVLVILPRLNFLVSDNKDSTYCSMLHSSSDCSILPRVTGVSKSARLGICPFGIFIRLPWPFPSMSASLAMQIPPVTRHSRTFMT